MSKPRQKKPSWNERPFNNPNVGKTPRLSKKDRAKIRAHFAKGDCPASHFRTFIDSIDRLDQERKDLFHEVQYLTKASSMRASDNNILADAVNLALEVLHALRSTSRGRRSNHNQIEVAYLRLLFARDRAFPSSEFIIADPPGAASPSPQPLIAYRPGAASPSPQIKDPICPGSGR